MPQKPQQRNKGLLNIEEILKVLPHRYPFLLIDRVLEMEKGKSIVAIKNVTFDEHFFQGHFPRIRVMPGVLIAESIAQAGGILLYHSVPNPEKLLVFLSKLDKTRFRKPVVPGDQLRIEVKIIKLKSKVCQIEGKVYVDGELVADGEAMASLANLEALNEPE
jgi:3-hydroxyacyl-[acyl-carrier-protein] dehydratase/UDP-3-O-[3-hydroxymyristoyl] N-acetylglucosamine deacetylase/3-hydroxyacyl-[acyl-carrier-protein] dehydratase